MVKIIKLECLRCGHKWVPRVENPTRCDKCGTRNWNSPAEKHVRKVRVGK